MALRLCFQKDMSCQAVFYALQTDLGLSLSDLATMTLIQAENLSGGTTKSLPELSVWSEDVRCLLDPWCRA